MQKIKNKFKLKTRVGFFSFLFYLIDKFFDWIMGLRKEQTKQTLYQQMETFKKEKGGLIRIEMNRKTFVRLIPLLDDLTVVTCRKLHFNLATLGSYKGYPVKENKGLKDNEIMFL